VGALIGDNDDPILDYNNKIKNILKFFLHLKLSKLNLNNETELKALIQN
jgi:hypothetical protein